MADNQAQQIMVSDAYHPQGKGGEWLGTQLERNPLTMGLDTEPETNDPRGGMVIAVVAAMSGALVGAVLGAVAYAMWLAQGVRP